MRLLRTVGILFAASFAASAATAQPQPPGTLSTDGKANLEVIPCEHPVDDSAYCRGIGLRRDGKLDHVAEGYASADLLWQRGPGAAGPDFVVRGNSGGSAGYADLFALDLSRGVVGKLSLNRGDQVTAAAAPGPLRLEVPFVVGYFNGAPHSEDTIVPVPLVWADGEFRADLAALAARPFPPGDLRFRELAVREELNRWRNDLDPGETIYPAPANALGGTPTTVAALLDLMLAGHADEARRLLHRAWPRSRERTDRPTGGEDAFWTDLCRSVAARDDWRKLGFYHLPHADLIEASARAPAPMAR